VNPCRQTQTNNKPALRVLDFQSVMIKTPL